MRLAGSPRRALAAAERAWPTSRNVPVEIFASGVLGEAELACGLVRSAASRPVRDDAALAGTGGGGFEYSCRIHLAQALALAGDAAGPSGRRGHVRATGSDNALSVAGHMLAQAGPAQPKGSRASR